jgi:hypothetical protein
MRSIFRLFSAACLLLFSLVVYSQTTPSTSSEAGSLPVGPFDLVPFLNLELIDDDNITSASFNSLSDNITTVSPGFTLSFDDGLRGISLDYLLEDATYSDHGENDYTDQFIDFLAGSLIADIHRIEFSAGLVESHDPRDSSPSGGLLDEYDEDTLGLSYTLGLLDSPFSIRLSASELERRYTSNILTTLPFNRDEEAVGFNVFYDLSTDIRLSLEYLETDITYIDDPNRNNPSLTRDSTEEDVGVGLNWEMSESLELQFLVGNTDRDIQDSSRTGFSGAFWDASLSWSPLSYSTFTVALARNTEENTTVELADFLVQRDSRFSWSHGWFDDFTTEITYIDQSIDYSASSRKDKNDELEIRFQYQFRRWVGFELFYRDIERDSDVTDTLGRDPFAYSREVIGISALVNL